MNGKLKEAVSHGTIALLYAAGLTLTLFHALGLTNRIGAALAVWLLTGGVSAA